MEHKTTTNCCMNFCVICKLFPLLVRSHFLSLVCCCFSYFNLGSSPKVEKILALLQAACIVYFYFLVCFLAMSAYVCMCVQTGKFSNMVDSLGRGTIAALARGGPKARVSAIWGMLLDLRRISYAT